jgi:hypothetical protein
MFKLQKLIMASMLLGGVLSALPVFAMQALNDEMLSGTTGQDGITLTLDNSGTSGRVIWTDNDGWSGLSQAAGAVVFGDGTQATNFRITGGKTVIKMDADGNSTNAFLNINIDLPDNLKINTGNVYVAAKNSTGIINQKKILGDTEIELNGLNINAQLGNAPQGNLLNFSGVINNGIRLNNFALIDGSTSSAGNDYGIGIDQIVIRDHGASDLTLDNIGISVTPDGLLIDTSRTNNKVDFLLSNVRVGSLSSGTPAIGGIGVLGVNLNSLSMTISGH